MIAQVHDSNRISLLSICNSDDLGALTPHLQNDTEKIFIEFHDGWTGSC